MADAEFTFESEQWNKILKRLKNKWDNILLGNNKIRREFSDIASSVVFKDIMDHFAKESGPDGKWKAFNGKKWSDSYAEHLKRIGREGKLVLQTSGDLRKSLTPEQGKYKNINEGVLFFSKLPYAAAHDLGSKKQNLPQRKFMWLSNKGMNEIVKQTLKWLNQ